MGRQNSYTHHDTAEDRTQVIEWASDTQRLAFEYGPGPQCASGGFGSGKTMAYCLKALALSDQFPRNRGVIARRRWTELQATTMSTFFKLCTPDMYNRGGRRADTEKYLRLNNGSEILWMHLDDVDLEGVIKGLEINWFFIDQAEEVEEEIFDRMRARLGRWDKAEVPAELLAQYQSQLGGWPWRSPRGRAIPPTYAMIACNPDVEFHWIYRRFHEDSPDFREKYSAEGYRMFNMPSTDNQFLPDQNKADLLAQDPAFVRRFVKGEWGLPEGRIHDIPPQSIVDGSNDLLEYLRATCTLYRSLDHGDSAPTVCLWWAVDRAGNVFCYREYYKPNQLVSYHRQEISQMSKGERYSNSLADPAIFIKLQQKHGGRWSTSDEYSDCTNLPRETALFWLPADNGELATRNRINEYLRLDPDRIHPVTKQIGAPRLYFVKKSPEYPLGADFAIRETRAQRRVKIGTELGKPIFSDDRDEDIVDHAYDCVRYLIASRPPVAVVPKPKRPARSFAAVREKMLQMHRSGQFKLLAKQARKDHIRLRARDRAGRDSK